MFHTHRLLRRQDRKQIECNADRQKPSRAQLIWMSAFISSNLAYGQRTPDYKISPDIST